MLDSRPEQFRNALLRGMAPVDLHMIAPSLERINLEARHTLEEPNRPIEHAYFIERGMASIIGRIGGERGLEVGMAGRDGMTGTALILGARQSPNSTLMQIDGWGWRLPAAVLTDCFAKSDSLRRYLLLYVQTLLVQIATTALANGHAKLEERLARWLLMTNDRCDGVDMRLTHEFLSVMLGVRRSGVTEAMHMLEGKGLIRANRGHVVVLDRQGLEVQANGSYGQAEAEYARLMGA